jgi:ferredoxin
METTIFYFSATGNSLSLTRRIADELGQCRIISIPEAINNNTIKPSTPNVGFVFPVYAWGLPRIVSEFLEKLSFTGKPYVFAVVTCVAIPGNTLIELRKSLRRKGAELNAGFAVKAGRSSLMKLNSLDKIIIRLDRQRIQLKSGESRLNEIVTTIKKKGKHRPETSSPAANIFGSLIHGMAVKTFKTMDHAFLIEDSCTGCGNCAKICPRSNIVIEQNRPVFKHNCELCHACIQWCQNFAIRHPDFDSSLKQYHHPAVHRRDLIPG